MYTIIGDIVKRGVLTLVGEVQKWPLLLLLLLLYYYDYDYDYYPLEVSVDVKHHDSF